MDPFGFINPKIMILRHSKYEKKFNKTDINLNWYIYE